jgi:predicted nucleic acid-binding protein
LIAAIALMIYMLPTQKPTTNRLFDTCLFIDHWRNVQTATFLINQAVSGRVSASFSIITEAELWAGIRSSSEEKALKIILSRLVRLPLIVPIARNAGSIRKNYGGKLYDAIIAATAEYHGLSVCTKNDKDFKRYPKVQVVTY